MEQFLQITEKLAAIVWGLHTVQILFLAGAFFTIYFYLPQIKFFWHSIQILLGQRVQSSEAGEISHFQALAAALSATIGLGNIAGVAIAVKSGGPGALFWMWVAAFLGMATKFTCISLALLHREIDKETGTVSGGPMYSIVNGLPRPFHFLAYLFSFFTIGAALGAGNMFQANQMAAILQKLEIYSVPTWLSGAFFALLTGVVLLGGIKRIGTVAAKLVPMMLLLYLVGALGVLGVHWQEIPQIFSMIFTDAFTGTAAIGGFTGVALREVIIQGVRRAVFSNEAGLGSSAMAHSAAKSTPLQEGFIGMLEPFIDTILICTLTGLVILASGVWYQPHAQLMEGSTLTAAAFVSVYGEWGNYLVAAVVVLFAFSTIISWSYYGEQGVKFLLGKRMVFPYRVVFTLAVYAGSVLSLNLVINISDILFGLMLIPNLTANFLMAPKLKELLKQYQINYRAKRL